MSDGRVHRVVIVGGGFAGLRVAKALHSPAMQVTLLDRRNHQVFQPLLYQVATGRTPPAFRYDDRVSMATIGRNSAIAQVGQFRFSGFVACGMWMFIHLLFTEQCHNRLLVPAQWPRSYFTGARSARLIKGASGDGIARLGSNRDDGAHASPAKSCQENPNHRSPCDVQSRFAAPWQSG